MNSETLITKMYDIKLRQEALREEIRDLERQSWDIYGYLCSCAVFDEAVLFAILELMSNMEGKKYTAFTYKTISGTFADAGVDIENLHVGITEESSIEAFAKSSNIGKLFKDRLGYEAYLKTSDLSEHRKSKDSFVGRYDIPEKNERTLITFSFLLDSFGALEEGYPVRTCKYDFGDYAYVQEFIRYLFDLQIEQNGKKLSYDDMKKALNDFINLMDKKAKNKKLGLN